MNKELIKAEGIIADLTAELARQDEMVLHQEWAEDPETTGAKFCADCWRSSKEDHETGCEVGQACDRARERMGK